MPHHIKTETLRDTGVIQAVPDVRYLPQGKMSCLDPSAAEAWRITPTRFPIPSIVAWMPSPYRIDF